jgi:hypothetical protein
VQVPGVASQASQPPPHGTSQQKPSAQLPDVHCAARVQAAPVASRATQVPPASQYWFAPQPASLAHPPGHAPRVPSQAWAHTGSAPELPAGRTVQVPGLVASGPLQTSQPPAQGASQQTPSTHTPERHWRAAVHAVPSACRETQAPAAQ